MAKGQRRAGQHKPARPLGALTGLPEMPPEIKADPEAKQLWGSISAALLERQLLLKESGPALESYIWALISRKEAQRLVATRGRYIKNRSGVPLRLAPWQREIARCDKLIQAFTYDFGFSPAGINLVGAKIEEHQGAKDQAATRNKGKKDFGY